jgi:hypothetical protein
VTLAGAYGLGGGLLSFAELLRLELSLQEQGEAIAALGSDSPRSISTATTRPERFAARATATGRVSAVLHILGFDPETAKHQAC